MKLGISAVCKEFFYETLWWI